MEGRAGRAAAKGQAVVARGLAVEGTAAVAGVEEEAPPAAERMAWVEVAGERVKEVASEGGRGVATRICVFVWIFCVCL